MVAELIVGIEAINNRKLNFRPLRLNNANVSSPVKHLTLAKKPRFDRACAGCDSSCFHKSRKCENLTFYKLQIWVFFGYGLFILDQVLKYVIRFWRINGIMKKTCILLVCLILSTVGTFHTILYYVHDGSQWPVHCL